VRELESLETAAKSVEENETSSVDLKVNVSVVLGLVSKMQLQLTAKSESIL
jgi:hypothetical protein